MVYICRIELNDVQPQIWRKFRFHPAITFHQLHQIIQIVMGWTDTHLYEFEVKGQSIGLPDPDFDDDEDEDDDAMNAKNETVDKHLKRKGESISYLYDFGDGWEHTIKLLEIDESADAGPAPACLGGERSCPVEDVGGPWRYERMLVALSNPDDPGRQHFEEWLDYEFDPEYFSCDDVNLLLGKEKKKLLP